MLYTDGEEEVLNLSLERWEMLEKMSPDRVSVRTNSMLFNSLIFYKLSSLTSYVM